MNLLRLWHRAVAHLCWLDLRILCAQSRKEAKLVVALECELKKPLRKRLRERYEFDLNHVRRTLKGYEAAISITSAEATRAAMKAML